MGYKIVDKDFFVALRGKPRKCDFCLEPKPLIELEPEEAGDWSCADCRRRWGDTDAV